MPLASESAVVLELLHPLQLQFTPWVVVPVGATALALGTAVYLLGQRDDPGGTSLLLLALSCAVWTGMQIPILLTGNLALKTVLSQLQYLGIASAPLAWFYFAVAWSGRRQSLRAWPMVIIYAIPVITVVLAFTQDRHGLLWSSLGLVERAGVMALEIEYGPWFRVFTGYSWSLVFFGTTVLALHIAQSPRHLWQLLHVLIAPGIVMVLSLAHLTGRSPTELLDPTPTGFSLATALLAWGLVRRGAVDVIPVAWTTVIEEMSDLVIVVDRHGRIVDLNRAAGEILGLRTRGEVPVELGSTWAGLRRGEARADGDPPVSLPLETRSGERRTFDMTVTPLGPRGGKDRSVIVLRDVTERERMRRQLQEAQERLESANRELERRANTDELTGLHSRRRFLELLEEELKRTRRYETPLTLLLLDLDHFKEVNDSWGHPVGDQVLRTTAEAIVAVCREPDIPGRVGGEELAVLLVETDQEGALRMAERIRRRIAALDHPAGETRIRVTASFGLATARAGRDTVDALVAAADAALYRAKDAGRDRVCVADEPEGQTTIDFNGAFGD